MPGTKRAGLAACVLTCAFSSAHAAGGWLTDPAASCAVFGSGERVAWTGACEDGLASGLGTATFFQDGKPAESFTADFNHGMVADGHLITRWGAGWSYDGEAVHGRFEGGGILINDRQDRYLGLWNDGRMTGFGLLDRADGSRYAGEWKNDLPNGEGELRHADGSVVSGLFVDGRLAQSHAAARAEQKPDPALKTASLDSSNKTQEAAHPFAALAGVALKGVDGSAVALNPIEGGIEMALTAQGGVPQKTTFTFMTDRLGTVVEDGGHGANVTGFFRLTDNGVELHYADGRAETLSATPEGGVAMVLTAAAGNRASCRSWYPDGHVFSESEKKAALADYAARLGLAASPADTAGCTILTPASVSPAPETITVTPHAAAAVQRPTPKPRAVKTAFAPPRPPANNLPANKMAPLTPVTVKDSQVHTIDDMVPPPAAGASLPGMKQEASGSDPSRCLKVDSDGLSWGFRNACDFAVQFAYCLPSAEGLAGCGKGGASGSVAARGFGALMADKSLSESGVDHSFRWIACAGGAGEVAAHLEKADPPSGRCDRAELAAAH
jgi:hypothetical protein